MRQDNGMRIREIAAAERDTVLAIVNAAARAYRGVIPMDVWKDPYMSAAELEAEIADGVRFWGAEAGAHLRGVIGFQDKGDVALIRHAYVAPAAQRSGVGTALLRHVLALTGKPMLVGTWADAAWAIAFYRRQGFEQVGERDKDALLRRYWSVPARQVEASVVLADGRWRARRRGAVPAR